MNANPPTKKQIIVRQYGLLPPANWGEDCREQLFLGNAFWNTLAEIERDNQAAWHGVFEQEPAYASLKARLDETNAALDQAWEIRKQERAKARAKDIPEDEAHKTKIKALSQERSALWADMKALRAKLKPALQDRLDALEMERRAKVKEARQQSGLFWCNYDSILDDYNIARVKAMKEGATLRFHAFDGSGRFVNRIQKGAKPAEIMAGRHNMFQIQPLPEDAYTHPFRGERRRKARTTLTITAYTVKKGEDGKHQRRTLEFPMVMHRPIPADADIKYIEVCAKRRGHQLIWTATVTATRESQEPHHAGQSACGLNLGWRKTAEGLRVATLADSQGRTEHMHLPASVIDDLDYCEQLQSELDLAADAMRHEIAQWIDEADLSGEQTPEGWLDAAKSAKASRSSKKLHTFAVKWWNWPYRPKWAMAIETWRKQDKRKALEMENLRAKAMGRRREAYRIFAKRIAESYAVIGIGQLNLKQSARLVDGTDETALPAPARKNRTYASLYDLVDWLGKQAAKTGAAIIEADRPVTDTCHACGNASPVKPDALAHTCQSCRTAYDRDENAALIALQDATGGRPPKPAAKRAGKPAKTLEKKAA